MCVAEEQQNAASYIILQQIDVPIERLLADFRWQSIDFVDALNPPAYPGVEIRTGIRQCSAINEPKEELNRPIKTVLSPFICRLYSEK